MGDVRNPRPHDICIVNKTIGIRIFSINPLPVTNEAIIKKLAYIPAGIMKIELTVIARVIESTVPTSEKGGAK